MWPNYRFEVPKEKRIRYIIHSDAKNEADDQYTIAHALMTDKFDVKGIIAGHFDNSKTKRFAPGETAKASYEEIEKIVHLMHLDGQYPILMGAPTGLPDEQTPIESEGAKFIVKEAMKDDPRPLFIGMQGAITDLASAILMEPKICERMTCIWIGGGAYPEGGQEFNLEQDINGVNVVLKSQMPFWQVTKTGYKQFTVTLAELQCRVAPYGQIGKYLFEQMVEHNDRCAQNMRWPHGESWSLGDEGCVAVLLEEVGQTDIYTEIDAPIIGEDMKYLPGKSGRKIRVYHRLNARLDLEDLYAKLQINFPQQDS
ncbi:MAG: nucleoside hydrolase [Lachnospiraceae bacterium]|nr:nucleoside hydrolase [Lachnospiraceae bacterium]